MRHEPHISETVFQPFRALPPLALTGLRAGQVLGYSVVVMFLGFVVASLRVTLLA